MKVIEEKDVFEKLDMKACIGLMREALRDLTSGASYQPMRAMYKLPGNETFGFMPAYVGPDSYYGAKVVVACPQNQGTEYPSHSGYVMLFEAQHGTVEGLVDAGAVTAIRTGAVSAVATDILANKDASILALIGAGVQGRSHIEAISLIRKIDKVKVYDINETAALKFKEEMSAKLGLDIEIAADVEAAVKDADIICTLTPSKEAYLKPEWVKEGAHINAVGTFTPATAEVTPELFASCKVYCDEINACKKESGEYLNALKKGLIDENFIRGSIGDVILGNAVGREDNKEITCFDALGQAIEDIAAAMYLM